MHVKRYDIFVVGVCSVGAVLASRVSADLLEAGPDYSKDDVPCAPRPGQFT